MPTKLDFSGVSDSFEPMPAGNYEAVFTGFKINDSKSTKGEQVCVLEFTIDDPEFSGRKAWANRSLQAQSLWILKKSMIALGADGETLAGPIDLEETLDDLKGTACTLTMSVREYEGRTSNQIDDIISAN